MKVMFVRTNDAKPIPQFTMNQKVAIEIPKDHGNNREVKVFRGKVIAITKQLVVIQKKSGIRESFSYKDFFTGHARLIQ
ncbi:hypothetical protein [Clostridium omnivorum]|uniref:Uncharacterized protein n=1 Tax=Clostridium omnivorum TaxID=1604902 RepID=A0ABQ5NC82_9CLOT|nr:hypothetical protein [Clostridium sp. E14]GLC32892.1 hypothetical protein bsdE14_43020 [Clostridium sp. E14]